LPHEEAEQLELGRGELDRGAVAGDLVRVLVEREVADDEHRVLRLRERERRAADEPAQPGHDLLEAERLRDVVVAAAVRPAMRSSSESFAVRKSTGVSCRRSARAAAPRARRCREHDVEHDRVGAELAGHLHGAEAVGGGAHVPTLVPQRHLQQLGQRVLVVDDEDATMEPSPFVICGARWVVGVLMTPVSAQGYAFPMTSMCGCRSPSPGRMHSRPKVRS
jgi:hypothetical protein